MAIKSSFFINIYITFWSLITYLSAWTEGFKKSTTSRICVVLLICRHVEQKAPNTTFMLTLGETFGLREVYSKQCHLKQTTHYESHFEPTVLDCICLICRWCDIPKWLETSRIRVSYRCHDVIRQLVIRFSEIQHFGTRVIVISCCLYPILRTHNKTNIVIHSFTTTPLANAT